MSNEDKLVEFINGTLDDAEREQLQQALEADDLLAREAAFMGALRQGIKQEEVTPPGELGLARLKKNIKDYEQNRPQHTAASGQRWWKPAAIAASALLILQTTALVLYQDQLSDNNAMQLLSGPTVEQGAVLQVVFAPGTQLAQVQALLLAIDGDIVRGPGALGLYDIRLPENADVEQALAQLRASAQVQEASPR
ncbi:MAG TPA: hypothetical protein VIC08_07075 [Cellvibrionaceae bacterium]